MFLNLFKPSSHHNVSPAHGEFVNQVSAPRRARPVDRFVVIGWALILIKCVLASIAIHHWSIPIGDFYVWGPSIIFGGLCTWLYLFREDDEE